MPKAVSALHDAFELGRREPQDARIGVVGATGAVGTVTLRLLRERGYANVRGFASGALRGRQLDG